VSHPIVREARGNVYFYQPLDPASRPGPGRRTSGAGRGAQPVRRAGRRRALRRPAVRPPAPVVGLPLHRLPTQAGIPGARARVPTDRDVEDRHPGGFPFELARVLGHPAGRIRRAAAFSRIFKVRITNQQVRSRHGGPLDKGSWVRYNGVDFGDAGQNEFQAHSSGRRRSWRSKPPSTASRSPASNSGDSWCPIPYWEVSPAYTRAGRKGPELFEVEFPPRTIPPG